jgi:hypothetical protein
MVAGTHCIGRSWLDDIGARGVQKPDWPFEMILFPPQSGLFLFRDQDAYAGKTVMPHPWWRSRAQRDHAYISRGERIPCFKVVPNNLRAGIGQGQRIGRSLRICIPLDDHRMREDRVTG